jgi:hypothetical protein
MVDVSPRPKTKSGTLSDVFWSAEISSSATTVSFAKAKQLLPFVDEKAPKSNRGIGSQRRRWYALPLVGVACDRRAQRVLERRSSLIALSSSVA